MVHLPWLAQYLNSSTETILYDVAGQFLPLRAAQPASQPLWAGESNDKIRALGLIQNNSGLFIIHCNFSAIEITCWQTLQETTCQSRSQHHYNNSQTYEPFKMLIFWIMDRVLYITLLGKVITCLRKHCHLLYFIEQTCQARLSCFCISIRCFKCKVGLKAIHVTLSSLLWRSLLVYEKRL